MSNPANTLPPDFDDIAPKDYDPAFTADISSKMRVPDKLGVNADDDAELDKAYNGYIQQKMVSGMNVPDRILVVGEEESRRASKDPRLALDFSNIDPTNYPQYVSLQTPPRVITLTDDPRIASSKVDELEDAEEDGEGDRMEPPALRNGYIPRTPDNRSSMPLYEVLQEAAQQLFPLESKSDSLELERQAQATPGAGLLIADADEDEIQLLHKQISKLSRHVLRLEGENRKRNTREAVFYPMVLGYMLFQVAKWLLTNK